VTRTDCRRKEQGETTDPPEKLSFTYAASTDRVEGGVQSVRLRDSKENRIKWK